MLVAEGSSGPAQDVARSLRAIGCAVLGPIGSAAQAVNVLCDGRPEIAIVGTQLQDGSAIPLVQHLVNADVPFALLASNDDRMLDHPLVRTSRLLPRPYSIPELRASTHHFVVDTLEQALRQSEQRIERAGRNIAIQLRIVDRLASAGHETKLARELLQAYEQALVLLQARQERLFKELTRLSLSRPARR